MQLDTSEMDGGAFLPVLHLINIKGVLKPAVNRLCGLLTSLGLIFVIDCKHWKTASQMLMNIYDVGTYRLTHQQSVIDPADQ